MIKNKHFFNFTLFLSIIVFNINFSKNESSFLNDIDRISKRIPGFVNPIVKSGIHLNEDELENVSKKFKPNINQNTCQNRTMTVVTRPKLNWKLFKDFDQPKIKNLEMEIDERLHLLREKIDSMKNNLPNIESSSDNVPVLDFPTPFEEIGFENFQNILQTETDVDPKVQKWIENIGDQSKEQIPILNQKNNKKVIGDPTLNKRLVKYQFNKPNWKGSAKKLVEEVATRDELLDEFDEEGRSIVPKFELENDTLIEISNKDFSNKFAGDENMIVTEPEELSIEENNLKMKPIYSNEIPGGEILGKKDYKYEGTIFSPNFLNYENLVMSSKPTEYIDFEKKMNNETQNLYGKSVRYKQIKNSRKKGKKHNLRTWKDEFEFSPPEFIVKSLKPQINDAYSNKEHFENLDQKLSRTVKNKKKAQNRKLEKRPHEFGYSELQFEFSEDQSKTPTDLSETSISIYRIPKKDLKRVKSEKKDFHSKSFIGKLHRSYEELADIEVEKNSKKKVEITENPNLRIIAHRMPSRAKNKKLRRPTNIGNELKSSLTQAVPSPKKKLPASNSEVLIINKIPKNCNPFEIKNTPEKSENSDIFEKESVKTPEYDSCNKMLKDLIQQAKEVEKRTSNINIPDSKLPRRNKSIFEL